MIDKYGLRYCDRCGIALNHNNNKCGYEICDKCNEQLEKSVKPNNYIGKAESEEESI